MTYIKLFALICAVTLSAALVTGCDHSSPPPPPPAPEPVQHTPNS